MRTIKQKLSRQRRLDNCQSSICLHLGEIHQLKAELTNSEDPDIEIVLEHLKIFEKFLARQVYKVRRKLKDIDIDSTNYARHLYYREDKPEKPDSPPIFHQSQLKRKRDGLQ